MERPITPRTGASNGAPGGEDPLNMKEDRHEKERMKHQRVAEAREALDKYSGGEGGPGPAHREPGMVQTAARGTGEGGAGVASARLLNAIANKHADAMDNIPAPVVMPWEPGDWQDAELLSKVLPAVLEMNDFGGPIPGCGGAS